MDMNGIFEVMSRNWIFVIFAASMIGYTVYDTIKRRNSLKNVLQMKEKAEAEIVRLKQEYEKKAAQLEKQKNEGKKFFNKETKI